MAVKKFNTTFFDMVLSGFSDKNLQNKTSRKINVSNDWFVFEPSGMLPDSDFINDTARIYKGNECKYAVKIFARPFEVEQGDSVLYRRIDGRGIRLDIRNVGTVMLIEDTFMSNLVEWPKEEEINPEFGNQIVFEQGYFPPSGQNINDRIIDYSAVPTIDIFNGTVAFNDIDINTSAQVNNCGIFNKKIIKFFDQNTGFDPNSRVMNLNNAKIRGCFFIIGLEKMQ